MAVLSVRLSDAEYKALDSFAKANDISMNKAIKDAFFEMLEDQYDLEA
ncbi:MAG: ribbon-helix-helix protein, CopG family, partial [Bacilli bacterium]|nr:ribbon-helix-helix protein, CopG family [Bacilli bacterium]